MASSWPAAASKPLELAEASDVALAHALRMRLPHAAPIAWRRFSPLVSKILVRSLGVKDIDDVIQDVFRCVFAKVPELRRPESLRAFIVSVTVRRMRHEIRNRRGLRRFDRIVPIEDADLQAAEIDTDAREALARFARILERMKAKDRRVFVLHVIEGVDLQEIARTLARSKATVRRCLARSRACAVRHAQRDPLLMRYLP